MTAEQRQGLNRGGGMMGRFGVEIELANAEDITLANAGNIRAEQVRRAKVSAMVDTGATRLVLPEAVVNQLGLTRSGTVASDTPTSAPRSATWRKACI